MNAGAGHEAMSKELLAGYRMARVIKIQHDADSKGLSAEIETFPTAEKTPEKLVFHLPREKADYLGIRPDAIVYVKRNEPGAPPPSSPPPPPPAPQGPPPPTAPQGPQASSLLPVLGLEGNYMGPGDVWVPRKANVRLQIPGVGEVAGFTDVGRDKSVLGGERTNPFNEDGFGIDLRSVWSWSLMAWVDGSGDVASKLAVESVLNLTADGSMHLGDALVETHSKVYEALKGPSSALTALRVLPDGSVEVANAADTRVLILRMKSDGTREVIEPFPPDTVATYFRMNPPQTTEQRQQFIDYYAQLGRPGLQEKDFQIGNTLQLDASVLNSMVRSGIGVGEVKEWNDQGRPKIYGPMTLDLVPELTSHPLKAFCLMVRWVKSFIPS
jgi:hypothetical protein